MYGKPTYTGLLTNYNSFTSPNNKKGLIKTLIDRKFCISSTWSGFHYDILNLKSVLQKNEFPLKFIDKSISKYLSNNVFKQKEHEQMLLITFYDKKAEPTELKWKRRKYNIRDSQCTLFSSSTELWSLALLNIIL